MFPPGQARAGAGASRWRDGTAADTSIYVAARRVDPLARVGYPYAMIQPKKTIGLLGCGVIGKRVGFAAEALGFGSVAFVHARHRDKALEKFPRARFVERVEDVAGQNVDLVVEAATSDVMRQVVLDVL